MYTADVDSVVDDPCRIPFLMEDGPMTTHPALHQLADEIEELRVGEFTASFYDDAARLARAVRGFLDADQRPASERFSEIVDETPRLEGRLRRIDQRRVRIERQIDLVLTTTHGTLRSEEVTRLMLFRLCVEVQALAHIRHDVVVESAHTDIGGPG